MLCSLMGRRGVKRRGTTPLDHSSLDQDVIGYISSSPHHIVVDSCKPQLKPILLTTLKYPADSHEVRTQHKFGQHERKMLRKRSSGWGSGPHRFKCSQCPAKFRSQSGLYYHKNIHLERFKCTICGRCLHSADKLQYHRSLHLT